ncbi:MAG: LysR family transcriptional regulator [Fusobacteriaceae bacterium]
MDLHYLRIFYEVAKEKSFTKAASKLYINQSAVSIQVKKFEDLLQAKLFDRSSKKIKLTYAGEALFYMAEDIFDKVKRAEREITRIINIDQSKIVIGASSVIGEPLLPKMMKEFAEKHPEIDFEIVISTKDHLLKALKEGALDIVIIDNEHITDPNLETLLVEIVPYVLVGKKEYSSMEKMASDPLITRKNIPNNNNAIMSMEKHNKITFTKRIPVTGNTEIIKSMVREGIGNVILPYYSVKKEVLAGELQILEEIEDVEDGYQIVITKDKRNLMQIIKFIKFIQSHKI